MWIDHLYIIHLQLAIIRVFFWLDCSFFQRFAFPGWWRLKIAKGRPTVHQFDRETENHPTVTNSPLFFLFLNAIGFLSLFQHPANISRWHRFLFRVRLEYIGPQANPREKRGKPQKAGTRFVFARLINRTIKSRSQPKTPRQALLFFKWWKCWTPRAVHANGYPSINTLQ